MSNKLLFDINGQVEPPTLVLASVGGRRYGEIPFIELESIEIISNLDDASEMSFDVDKYQNGVENPLWNKITNFKLIWYKELNKVFTIQVDINDDIGIKKHITAQSAGEVELGQILLHNIEINTEDDRERDDYVRSTLYKESNPDASILDRILAKAPHYNIAHVDYSIADVGGEYSFDDDSIKDALDELAEGIGCLFLYDVEYKDGVMTRSISAYDLQCYCEDCGERFESGSVCPECGSSNIKQPYGDDTGIIIDKESLAETITLETDVDSVKNCFLLQAGDDVMTAAVRMCLPSSDGYLWYLTQETMDDMSDELQAKIAQYNTEYEEYSNTKTFNVSDTEYEELVTKYYDADDCPVQYVSTPVGFSAVIDNYYNAVTLQYYVKTSMMPTVSMSDTNAQSQINDIVNNLEYVAISGLSSSTSQATVESAIKSAAKMWYYTSAYDISISNASWSNPTWKGTITLTNENDDTDTAYATMTIPITNEYEKYVSQQLQKKLSTAESSDTGVVALFNKEESEFKTALKLYSADMLSEYKEICKTLLDILIEQGCGDSGSALYEDVYLPYYRKLQDINYELAIRNSEVDTIANYIDKLVEVINNTHEYLNMATYLGDTLYTEFAAYRREDTFSNDNYISDSLSDSEIIDNARRFINVAEREIYKSATQQHSITATLYNLLLMPEFKSLLDNFKVGNWIRIIVDGSVYKLRLLSFTIDFATLQNISVTFSDVTKTMDGYSDLKSIISQASSMATSYGSVSRQAEKAHASSESFQKMFKQGLDLTNTKLLSSSDSQDMTIDQHGLTMRRYDPILDDYVDEQIKLTNTTIAFTDDNWETVKTAFGKYYDGDGNELYGLVGENIIGKVIAGGNLSISAYGEDGDRLFLVNEDGVTLKNSSMQVECDNGAEVVIDPTNGFAIGAAPLVTDGVLNTNNAKLWIDTDGNLKITLSNGDDLESAVNNANIVAYKTYYQIGTSNTEFPTDSTIDTISGTYNNSTGVLSFSVQDVELHTGDTIKFYINNLASESYTSFVYGYQKSDDSYDETMSSTIEALGDAYEIIVSDEPGDIIRWTINGTDAESDTDTSISIHVEHNGPSYNWYTDIPKTPDGSYLWVATYVTYSDGSGMWSTPYCITDEEIRERLNDVDQTYANYILGDSGINAQITSINNVLSYGYTDDDGVTHDGLTSQVSQVRSDLTLKASSSDVTIEITKAKTDVLNSVDHVTTTTGFTFDEDGLTVTNSNVNVSTNVNADGMVIKSNSGDTLLTVNSSGVEAINLNSSKYLIIGGRSRFENFGTSYTGCFWLG